MADIKEVSVPDIGNAQDVDVIEVHIKPGKAINKEDALITLESDKATMDIPSPYAGIVKDVKLKTGDKVSQGSMILTMEIAEAAQQEVKEKTVEPEAKAEAPKEKTAKAEETKKVEAVTPPPTPKPAPEMSIKTPSSAIAHAGPSVRRFSRELGVDLEKVIGTGPKSRILKEDVQSFVKAELQGKGGSSGYAIPSIPPIDFSQFGAIETKPLSRIKKLTGVHVHRSWVTIPHVTQFDEADITELEAFRQAQKSEADAYGVRLTVLVFIMKAVVASLKAFPNFNSSLDASGENIILKNYFHIGVAVDTPDGLVVPVVRDVDQKGLFELAKELAEISQKARNKSLLPKDMQGSSFTISSLGGIGGTAFTPIVNMPDVAILGVSKSAIKPVYQDKQFIPRLMLPLSLSYDHRVIDGAEGARFSKHLVEHLADIRKLLL